MFFIVCINSYIMHVVAFTLLGVKGAQKMENYKTPSNLRQIHDPIACVCV